MLPVFHISLKITCNNNLQLSYNHISITIMKLTLSSVLLVSLVSLSFIPFKKNSASEPISPLAVYSIEWNNAKYLKCNTAANAMYMTAEERKTIYILNLARMNPLLFANTVVQQYSDKDGKFINRKSSYYISLLATLKKTKPKKLLYPDSLCYKSALCHAASTGKAGTVTHDRTKECRRQQYFSGECCQYGYKTALDILLSLLIDEGISSLGHRNICLDNYEKLGVSIQPHTSYRYTTVLDFK